MNEISNDVFSEVYGFLKLLDESYVEKIPEELRNLINEKRNPNYSPKYNSNIPLANQKMCKQALAIITVINLDYLANDEEKDEINRLLRQNSKIHEDKLRKQYNIDDVFSNKKMSNDLNIKEDVNNKPLQIERSNQSFIKKIFYKIKQLIFGK